jgi:hypothetical protein
MTIDREVEQLEFVDSSAPNRGRTIKPVAGPGGVYHEVECDLSMICLTSRKIWWYSRYTVFCVLYGVEILYALSSY